jgi:hypothetical protein
MKTRIAIWAGAGALVVVLWSAYLRISRPAPLGPLALLLDLSCPIALARHHRMTVYFVLAVNAATYAGIGAVVELARRLFRAGARSSG